MSVFYADSRVTPTGREDRAWATAVNRGRASENVGREPLLTVTQKARVVTRNTPEDQPVGRTLAKPVTHPPIRISTDRGGGSSMVFNRAFPRAGAGKTVDGHAVRLLWDGGLLFSEEESTIAVAPFDLAFRGTLWRKR